MNEMTYWLIGFMCGCSFMLIFAMVISAILNKSQTKHKTNLTK
jgi:hypothetical protein